MYLPEIPLSFSSTGRFSRHMDSKAVHNLGFLHPSQFYPTGSEYLFSDLVQVLSTQAQKTNYNPSPLFFGLLTWHTLLFPSVHYNSAASSSSSFHPCLLNYNVWPTFDFLKKKSAAEHCVFIMCGPFNLEQRRQREHHGLCGQASMSDVLL